VTTTKKKLLPKIDKPIFEIVLPSTKEKIKYTSFTVKEEKILLIAKETKDIDQAILSIKQVVNNCLIEKNVEDLSMFDLEYIIIKLRSQSIDNTVAFSIKDPETKERVNLELNLDNVKLSESEDHSKEIRINNDFVLIMKYPTINEFLEFTKKETYDAESNFKTMIRCMDKLVGSDEVYNFRDFTQEEIEAFSEDLDSNAIKKIKHFFDTMPTLRHEIKYTNSNGKEQVFVIEGMQTFFI
jgi:hypothetical protein